MWLLLAVVVAVISVEAEGTVLPAHPELCASAAVVEWVSFS